MSFQAIKDYLGKSAERDLISNYKQVLKYVAIILLGATVLYLFGILGN